MASVWDEIESGPSRKAPVARSVWDDIEGGFRKPKDPERTVLGTLGDVGVTALKGAVGLPQAFVGLADIPTGGRVGKALEEIGYRPEETQKILDTWYSDAQQAANAKVQQADGFVDTLTTALQNPSTILRAAGESLPQMVGGAGIARGILKVAPKLAPWKAAAAGEGILGAGAAASQIRAETEDGLLTPTQSAIAGASGLGTAVLGAAGAKLAGRLGLGDVDTALAQGALGAGKRGLLRNVGGSALSEGVFEELPQSVQEQVWQNVALGKPWDEGVGNAAAMGMLAGGLTGGGFGALNNRAVESNLLRREEDAARQERERQEQLAPILGMIRPDSGLGTQAVIDQQLGIDPSTPAKELEKQRKAREADILAAFNEPSGVRVAGADGQERELSAIEAALMQQGLPTTPIAETPAPAAPASRVYSPEEQELIDMRVVPNGNALSLLAEMKATGIPLESSLLTPVITAMSERKNAQAKKLLAQAIIDSKKAPAPVASVAPTAPAVSPAAPTPTVAPTVAPTPDGGLRVVKGTPPAPAPTPSVAQAPGVTSLPVPEVPTDVQAPQAVQAEAQGEAPLAAAAAQGAAPAAEPVVQRKRRVVNPAAMQQSQAFVAPEAVAQEEAAADPTDESDWEDSKPDGAPALTALTPSLQQVWAEARAAKAQGRRVNLFKVAEDIVAEQGDEATDDDTLTTLNQIFGERDAAMLYDRYVDNMTEEAIANKYGLSRQAVAKVTGEGDLGQKTRATKIKNAQKKYGWTDEYVQQLAARLTPAQAETETAVTSGRTGVDLEATESAFGADTAPEMGGRDPSLREAGFSTSASLGGSVSNWRDSGELAGREDVSQADQAKLDELYARRAAAEEAGNDEGVESADAEISMVETKYLSVSEAAAKITQTSMDLRDRADKRRQQIEQARAAGKTEVSVNNKLVPIAQLEAEAEALTAKAQEAIDLAEAVLQRGAVRKAKGAEPKAEKPKAEAPKVRRVKKADAAAPAAPAATTAPAEVLTPTESAARAWDQATNTIPGAPKWADLPAPQQREFVGYGENNWTRQDVVAMMQRGAPKPAAPKVEAPETPASRFRRADAPKPAEQGSPTRKEGPSGYSFPSSDVVMGIRNEFEPTEVQEVAIGGTSDGFVNFGAVNSDGRYYIQSKRKVITFSNGKWGTPTTRGMDVQGTYDPNNLKDEVVRVLTEQGAKRNTPSAENRSGASGAKFSKATKSGGTTVYSVYAAISKFFYRTPESFSSYVGGHIRVHQTEAQAVAAVKGTISAQEMQGAQGFVDPMDDRVVHLVADNIPPGAELAVLLHEVGVHAGLLGRLGANFELLAQQVRSWGKLPESTLERRVHDAAMARVAVGRLDGSISDEVAAEELVAYAAEEAVLAGVLPSDNASDRLSSWLGKLKKLIEAAFNSLLSRKIAMKALTAQNLVDFAKGAAEQHLQSAMFERGAMRSASPAEVLQYYAKTTYGEELHDDAKIENFDEAEPGTEPVFWGAGSSFGPHEAITTYTDTYSEGGDSDHPKGFNELNLYILNKESLALARATGNSDDAVLQTISLSYDAQDHEWSLAVFGPKHGSALFRELKSRGQATELQTTPEGYVWTRLEGVPIADTVSMLSEARRRLTRALEGEVPDVYFVRTTGAKPGKAGVMPASEVARRFSKAPRATERLPAELRKPVGTITNVLNDTKNAALNTLTFTEDVINRAISLGVEAAGRLRTIYQERAALTGKLEREVERVADLYNRVPEAERGTGDKSVNKFLYDATREGKWGFKPSWRKGTSANVKVDADMKQRYDALSKESKALVEAVFKHGDEVLSLKKQTVITAADSEYDALIAEANKKNDAKKAASLAADKAAQLKRFNSLFELQEFKPYAPLKRFGNYVVIARSQKFIDADEKTQAKLENSGDDYHVSFAESAFAAREMVEQLRKQGAFAQVTFREREDVDPAMAGGALSAFNKLRATLDSELADAEPNEKAAIRAARKVIGELYLSTLAETSARKSEMRRRGVAGEIDMLRSFTTQGRADAQFIAGAKYNKQTLDAFNAMRKEVRKPGQGEAENTKSGVVNELLKRHAQSMQYDPSPVMDKLARMTSVWFLATSPAYYLQNLTQPFMMSMPFMTKRHNYLKIGTALIKAYSDLAPMFRKVKVGEQFDYASAPADVRAAISTLVDRGRIDIGMDTDLGTFRLEGEGPVKDRLNKFDRGIRNISQKMEAINRLATAIAAYRMELAKTGDTTKALDYADDVITQTHGDYTRTNAPRAFNTAPGKIALQFRKFQLIQLTLLAKLIKNSFTGKDRAAAFKALSFTLAHTAVMAGAIGIPGFAAASWALGAMMGGGDDEPFNLEQWLREQTGNEQLATLLTRGVPAALGVDLSQKLGSGNVLSLLPFNDLDLSSRSGVESAAFAAFGGPAGGLTLRAIDGVNLMRDGQYYRGLEQLMPTGVTNAMKAYRIANEGVTRRNGDELMSPDEISGMESFWQAIGFQPTDQALRQFRDKVKREADDKFQSKAEKIRNAFLRAKDDPDARAEARERWAALQDAREEAGYRRQPLSSLMRAEQNQRQRERNTLGGIQFNRDTRRFVEDLVTEDEE